MEILFTANAFSDGKLWRKESYKMRFDEGLQNMGAEVLLGIPICSLTWDPPIVSKKSDKSELFCESFYKKDIG